jgi:hypothetical protein
MKQESHHQIATKKPEFAFARVWSHLDCKTRSYTGWETDGDAVNLFETKKQPLLWAVPEMRRGLA